MQIKVGSDIITLTPQHQLGIGGEGTVYKEIIPHLNKEMAIKIFHPIDPSMAPQARVAHQAILQRKFDKAKVFPHNLPMSVLYPKLTAEDLNGKRVGLVMDLSDGTDISNLGRVGWKEKASLNLKFVTDLFKLINLSLEYIHQAGVIVGDLNDGNIQFTSGLKHYFIDTDSMQLKGYPCIVAHERFLDPRFYGADLATQHVLDAGSDFYALAIMLFSSLLSIHPYAGNHPKFTTMLRRAEARHSILKGDVGIPKKAIPFKILNDELLHYFIKVFDEGEREKLNNNNLLSSSVCPTCNIEHFRRVCPLCQSGVTAQPVITICGNFRVKSVIATRGRILYATHQSGLKVLWEEGGDLYRESATNPNNKRLLMSKAGVNPDMKYAISLDNTYIGQGNKIACFTPDYTDMKLTGVKGNRTVLGANSQGLYRIPGDSLFYNNERVGSALEGQTWLWVGEGMAFGFYQVGQAPFFLLHRSGERGTLNPSLPLDKIDGKIKDAKCYFDLNHILFMFSMEKVDRKGIVKTWNYAFLIRKDGTVTNHTEISEDDDIPWLKDLNGKMLYNGVIYAITDKGIMTVIPGSHGDFHQHELHTNTANFVGPGDDLLPGPYISVSQGILSVFVINVHEVRHLTNK